MGEGPSVKAGVDSYQQKYVGKNVMKAVEPAEGGNLGVRVKMTMKAARCVGKTVMLRFECTQTGDTTILKVHKGRGGGSVAKGYLLRVGFGGNYSLNVKVGSKGSSVTAIDEPTAKQLLQRLAPLDPLHEPRTGFAPSAVLKALDRLVGMYPSLAWEDALLCQDVFPGTGNVMKIECLYAFHLHPRSAVADTGKEVRASIVDWLADFSRRWYRHKVHNFKLVAYDTAEKRLADKPEPMGTALVWLDSKGDGHNNNQPRGYDKYGRKKKCVFCNTDIKAMWQNRDRILFSAVAGTWGAVATPRERLNLQRRTYWCPTCQGPLESRFKGMIFTVSPRIRRRAEIERLVIAHGGIVLGLKSYKCPEQAPVLTATHHVLPADEDRAGHSGTLAVMTVDELLSHIDHLPASHVAWPDLLP